MVFGPNRRFYKVFEALRCGDVIPKMAFEVSSAKQSALRGGVPVVVKRMNKDHTIVRGDWTKLILDAEQEFVKKCKECGHEI